MKNETYHFIGIGGSGMSGLARLLLHEGVGVTGSDQKDSATLQELAAAGAHVHVGHRAGNINGATRVVYSAAIPEENPEVQVARERGLPIISRAQLLGEMLAAKSGIAIAGTHGKTTTTGMTASIFLHANADPTILVGGDWAPIRGNARPGSGPHVIAEACEAFNSFLELRPHVAVVTNVEADHLDCHGSLEGVIAAFEKFLSQVAPDGCAVLCGDDANVRQLIPALHCRHLTYGLGEGVDLRAVDLDLSGATAGFSVVWRGERLGAVRLGVPGRHNVLNALAAVGVALDAGLPFEAVRAGLADFTGVGRRFELLGEAGGVRVMDDYAHHPTEVTATLQAAREAFRGRLVVMFQPHLFSRTQLLMEEFAGSFGPADRVIIADIYPAREAPIPGVTAEKLAARIEALEPGKDVHYVGPKEAAVPALLEWLQPGDVVFSMGAGDIRQSGEKLLEALRGRAKN